MGQMFSVTRRGFLAGACSLAAAPAFAPVSFAAMPGDRKDAGPEFKAIEQRIEKMVAEVTDYA